MILLLTVIFFLSMLSLLQMMKNTPAGMREGKNKTKVS